MERHKRTFYPIARTIEDFYRLAGEDELAEKVRPSVTHRGRRAIEVEEPPEGAADEASTEEPSPNAEATAPNAVTASDAGDETAPAAMPTDAGSPEA